MMKQISAIIIIEMSLILIMSSNAVYWSSSVDTNSSHWSIYRQSSNMSFYLTSSVEGVISAGEFHGRILSPYQAYYADIEANDLKLKERTSALEGTYKSTDEISMQSTVYPDEIEITVDKPVGTEVYTIEYKNEYWPVSIKTARTIDYSGRRINDRDFEGNSGDFAGTNFFHNSDLHKDRISVMWLQRMNATVLATNDSIILAEFKPVRYLGYMLQANFSGMADISYKQSDYKYNVKLQDYPSLSEGYEKYYGIYNLTRKIEMVSAFENYENEDENEVNWLPCNYGRFKACSIQDGRLEFNKFIYV